MKSHFKFSVYCALMAAASFAIAFFFPGFMSVVSVVYIFTFFYFIFRNRETFLRRLFAGVIAFYLSASIANAVNNYTALGEVLSALLTSMEAEGHKLHWLFSSLVEIVKTLGQIPKIDSFAFWILLVTFIGAIVEMLIYDIDLVRLLKRDQKPLTINIVKESESILKEILDTDGRTQLYFEINVFIQPQQGTCSLLYSTPRFMFTPFELSPKTIKESTKFRSFKRELDDKNEGVVTVNTSEGEEWTLTYTIDYAPLLFAYRFALTRHLVKSFQLAFKDNCDCVHELDIVI